VALWACAGRDLEAAGVPPAAVTVAALCTMSDDRFFSHRRDRGSTGRHLASPGGRKHETVPEVGA